MKTISLSSLRSEMTFDGDLLIDDSFILLPKAVEITERQIQFLQEWGFESVYCKNEKKLSRDIGIPRTENSYNQQNKSEENQHQESFNSSVKSALEDSKVTQIGDNDRARMNMVEKVATEYLNYIESVFIHYSTHKEINQNELSDTVQDLCIFIKEHKPFVLRLNPTPETSGKNFLVVHSFKTTVVAIAIALQLRLPLSKMIDLGVACVLHEIGMLRLPPQLYMTTKLLSPIEKSQISKHPLLGYTIAKDLKFSLPIQLGILEHHEKQNGTGYPRHLLSDKISSIAKIIAVACSYEAISTPRQFKEKRSTFDALLELVQNSDNQYDNAVIKALLFTVSLYPIGTCVYLSNRKAAIVVDTNPNDPKFPIVQLLVETDKNGSLIKLPTTKELSILRVLSKQEEEDILKLVKEKYNAIEEAKKELELIKKEELKGDLSPKKEQTENSTKIQKEQTVPTGKSEEIDISFFD